MMPLICLFHTDSHAWHALCGDDPHRWAHPHLPPTTHPSSSSLHANTTAPSNQVAHAAVHPELVLVALRSLHYARGQATAARFLRARLQPLAHLLLHTGGQAADAEEELSRILALLMQCDALARLCLRVFRYELWCTSKVDRILFRFVTFLGPYTHPPPTTLLHMYESHCHDQQPHHHHPPPPPPPNKNDDDDDDDRKSTSFVCTRARHDAARATARSRVYYGSLHDIPRDYQLLAREIALFHTEQRCASRLWKQHRHAGDERDRFNEIKTNILVLLAEYNHAHALYHAR